MAVKHIPGVERSWFEKVMRKKWPVEFLGSVPPIFVAVLGAYRLIDDPVTRTMGLWSAGIAVWLLLASLGKIANARALDVDSDAKRSHDGLRAAILVLQASASRACGLAADNVTDLRVTFHAVVPPLNNSQEIEQLVPYAGGAGGGEGRRFSIRSGITGRCIRTKQLYIMHRDNDDDDDYRQKLEADWGYTNADAATLSKDIMSCMAVPVLDVGGRQALGVIYLDSKHSNLFESEEMQESIFAACAGVTRYVSERYSK